jgi:hypothetical protein
MATGAGGWPSTAGSVTLPTTGGLVVLAQIHDLPGVSDLAITGYTPIALAPESDPTEATADSALTGRQGARLDAALASHGDHTLGIGSAGAGAGPAVAVRPALSIGAGTEVTAGQRAIPSSIGERAPPAHSV